MRVPDKRPDALTCRYQNNTEDLLKELICQRLAQNFQIVGLLVEDNTKPSRLRSQPAEQEVTYLLSLGIIFHKIIYKPEQNNIVVKRYHQRGYVSLKTNSRIQH
jgi:hypothetical protein